MTEVNLEDTLGTVLPASRLKEGEKILQEKPRAALVVYMVTRQVSS